MASDRELAKRSITSQEASDPELEVAISSGHHLQLELSREKNRHVEAKIDKDLGVAGRFLGGKEIAPITIATFVVALCYLAAIGCMIMAGVQPELADFWSKQAERTFGVGSAALTYIFGKGGKA